MEGTLNRIKQFPYTDILGWSVSRYDKFMMCRRQYYYDYYGKYDREIPRSKIMALKQMTSAALETGNIVHDTVKVLLERLLKSEAPIDRGRFLDFALRKGHEYCAAKTFAEVYYKDREKIDEESILGGVTGCLNNFLGSERFAWVTEKALTNKKNWVIEPPGFGETRIGGMKAYCKVDFLFPVDGSLYILDWKTGKMDEKKHRKQLVGYATWAAFHFEADPATIVPLTVYLTPTYRELQIQVNEFDTQEFVGTVERETKEMYTCCAVIEKNLPKDKTEFPQTKNTAVCRFCNYRELCK